MKLEKIIGDRLRERGWTLSIAESCTGGLISDRLTDVPGSSDYFEGGMVTYSNESKAKHLGIPLDYIKNYGAVSPQVAGRWLKEFGKLLIRHSDYPPQVWQDQQEEQKGLPLGEFSSDSPTEEEHG